jgi:hypothetical protein
MNQRIRQLAEQAGFAYEPSETLQKFAQLIVRECVDRVTSKANGWGDMTGFAIKESILDCAKDLKEHFGVEE